MTKILLAFAAVALIITGGPRPAAAIEIAMSDLTFSNFDIVPTLGSLELLIDWEIEAYAEARNSLWRGRSG